MVCWQYAFSSARPPTSTNYGNFSSRLLHTMLILEGLLIDFFHLAIFLRSTFRQLRWLILMTACNGPCHDTRHCATHDLLRNDSLRELFFQPLRYLFFIIAVSQLSAVHTLHATQNLQENFWIFNPIHRKVLSHVMPRSEALRFDVNPSDGQIDALQNKILSLRFTPLRL